VPKRATSKLPDLILGATRIAGEVMVTMLNEDPALARRIEKELGAKARRLSKSQIWVEARAAAAFLNKLNGLVDYVVTDEAAAEMRSGSGVGATPKTPTAYDVLGVSPNAPVEVIQAAWRALMIKYHPDRGGSEEAAKKINEAFEAIKRERHL
jgi:DnaJ-domain-containing protein 1